MNIGVIIPAADEEKSVGSIVRRSIRAGSALGSVRVVVTDNDSRDQTAQAAREAGAEVVFARPRGYGRACLKAISHLGSWPDVLVFVDADGSSPPEEMKKLLEPLQCRRAELVIGVRNVDAPMTLAQRWGNRLAVRLISCRWGHRFSDLGPFRAIRRGSYESLHMTDETWGWTVEMQILALIVGLSIEEVPVSWERRLAGKSKISGTLSGVLRAGFRILWTIARYSFRSAPSVRGENV